jgi:hypothetical protein
VVLQDVATNAGSRGSKALLDGAALKEIEILADLLIAATSSKRRLTPTELDIILGIVEAGDPRPGAREN